MLTERDAKVEQLSAQLKSANAMAVQPSAPNQESAARDSGAGEEDGRPQPASAFDGMSDLKLEFQGQIMKLQQYIEANNLRHVDPLGMPPSHNKNFLPCSATIVYQIMSNFKSSRVNS